MRHDNSNIQKYVINRTTFKMVAKVTTSDLMIGHDLEMMVVVCIVTVQM